MTATSAFPPLHAVRQRFERPVVADVPAATRAALDALGIAERLKGKRVGLTVGSRGIAAVVTVLRTAVVWLRERGAEPRLLAAMGSHGGGTEAGQRELLESLGVTEAAVGAPVVPCAESRVVGTTADGLRAFTLGSALEVDALLPVNRVKTHTSFKGAVESGLVKMLAVGLGGPAGAEQFHRLGQGELARVLVELGELLLGTLPVLGGLAVLENAYEETAELRPIRRDGFVRAEAEALLRSKALMPSLPVDAIDLLVVREMGKEFSGTGLDTNIVGRTRIRGVPEPERPAVKRIAVLELGEASHGNATGVGLADFVTRAVVERIDRQKTYLNCLTSTFVERAFLPIWLDTEREVLEAAARSLPGVAPAALRVVVIANTLHLERCLVSGPVAAELRAAGRADVDTLAQPVTFDADGRMAPRV